MSFAFIYTSKLRVFFTVTGKWNTKELKYLYKAKISFAFIYTSKLRVFLLSLVNEIQRNQLTTIKSYNKVTQFLNFGNSDLLLSFLFPAICLPPHTWQNQTSTLRWPKPIYMHVGYVFLISFFSRSDLTDFYDFLYP